MTQTFFAIDDVSLPLRKNVCLYLSKPTVRPESVLVPSDFGTNAPDDLAVHFYGTVLHENGKFRMWYYACHRGLNPDWPPLKKQQVAKKPDWISGVKEGYELGQGPLCYAESNDGIHWTKPALGQVMFKGSLANNALDLPHTIVSGAAVIRDDADPDASRRYKMVYQFFPDQSAPVIEEYGFTPSIACAVSPDGLKWKMIGIPFVNQFVEHCSLIHHNGQYIVHSQEFPGKTWCGTFIEGGTAGGRTAIAHATYDFDHWPDLWQWAFALPEPADHAARGVPKPYDQVHIGIGAASFGNVCIGIYGIWHDRADFADIECDLGLVISNDGIHFREPAATPGQVFIHRDESPGSMVPGRNFKTALCQGNGILNVGDQTLIYHGRWRNVGTKAQDIGEHYHAEVALATLPRDRWGALALNPGRKNGAVVSLPVTLPASGEIHINADGVAGMTFDLLDEKMQPVAAFTNGLIAGSDGLDCPVRWSGHSLAELGNRTVRIKVNMKRTDQVEPKLFAVYVK